jgi:hypothetical protein
MKFRKKPVVIDALQFDGLNEEEIQAFTGADRFRCLDLEDVEENDFTKIAEVFDFLHNTWVGVSSEDWIIKGVQGEFYPCNPDVFTDTYEAVEQ